MSVAPAALLDVRELVVEYATSRGPRRAVDGVSFELVEAGCLALVGESGSGKSTLARAILRLLPIASGSIMLLPRGGAHAVDWTRLRGPVLRALRPQVQIVFQDPLASLDPRMLVGDAVAEVFAVHERTGTSGGLARAAELFERVGLSPDLRARYPHELSGGERQRVAIARALACRPRLLVCDEVVSALDVSVQAQVLNLLAELRASLGIAYLFISHDLAVVRQVADDIAVMHAGRIRELGTAEQVLERPRDAYTRALIDAVPRLE